MKITLNSIKNPYNPIKSNEHQQQIPTKSDQIRLKHTHINILQIQ